MPKLAERLSAYAAALDYSDLSKKTAHEAKRHLIDSLGCGIGALHAASVKKAIVAGPSVGRGPASTIFGSRAKISPDWAAFVNGYAIRYFDWNDSYLSKEPAHPSDNIGAILSTAEAYGASGKDILTAIALAYEIQCRLCDAASLRARGWDHVNYLLVSAALAAGKLMRLNSEQMTQAVNISLNNLSTRQNRVGLLSEWKGAAAPNAARNGVFAAMLARQDFTGPKEIFEGKWGFWNKVSGRFALDTARFGGRGREFMITKTIVKKHNAEIHAQSAVDAALKLRPGIKDVGAISSIVVETHEAGYTIIGRGPEKWRPRNKETADHSMPYIVAAALMDGKVTPAQYRPERIADLRIRRLMRRIKVVENKAFTRAYPAAIPNRVVVKLKGGKTVSAQVTFPLGHPRNPMSDAEVVEKFDLLTKRVLSKSKRAKILRWAWHIEKQKSVGPLFRLLR